LTSFKNEFSAACPRCGLILAPGEGKMIHRAAAIPAIVAFSFLHAGMWINEALREPFCPRCRAFVTRVAAAAAVAILCAASLGVGLWLSGGKP
jgi:hypothetical protein